MQKNDCEQYGRLWSYFQMKQRVGAIASKRNLQVLLYKSNPEYLVVEFTSDKISTYFI